MSEKSLENKIKLYLKNKKIWYIKTIGSGMQRRGIPDILCCVNGKFIAFEIKNPNKKGKISIYQELEIKKILQNKGKAFVIDDYQKFLEIIFNLEKDV